MAPRTRATKSTKALKENIGIPSKPKAKAVDKVTKPPRKVLGDKTNSASDDNASIEILNKPAKTTISDIKHTNLLQNSNVIVKSRRERRVPSRFVDCQISKNKENTPIDSNINSEKCLKKPTVPVDKITVNDTISSIKNDSAGVSPFKTPQKLTEVSLVANRPRRISRLPSRFEDHSVSPSKFIPVQPCHASTPLATKTAKTQDKVKTTEKNDSKKSQDKANAPTTEKAKLTPGKNKNVGKKTIEVTPDTNNNAKGRSLRSRKAENNEEKQPMKSKKSPVKMNNTKKEKNPVKKLVSPQKNKTVAKKVLTPAKKLVSPLKQKPKKVVSPAKNITTKTKKSPVKLPSPVKHSYLNSVNKSPSFTVEVVKSPIKLSSPVKKPNSRTLRKDLSFKVLEENKKKQNNQDIYEFTFDPSEEPAPQKKKRKAVKRKPAKPKPKAVIFKNNYDQNVNKALAVLKNVVTKKAPEIKVVASTQEPTSAEANKIATPSIGVISNNEVKNAPQVQRNIASKIIIGNTKQTTTNNIKNIPQIQQNILLNKVHADVPPPAVPIPEPNQSIRVEDIAADFEFSPQHDMDYSPVNSPDRPITPVAQISRISDLHHSNDPLNLRENISFDPNPIASSSMNTSVRHPKPSPWRVEFESLPIRWHVNSYVKPNMTPAVECSFVNFDDKNKRKHVYTNLVPEHNEDLPEIVQKDQPNLIQSSIISFIKEQIEKSSSKKKRARSVTPVTASLFNDTADTASNKDDEKVKKTTKQLFTPKKNNDKARSDTSNPDSTKDTSNDKENSKDSSRGLKRKNNEEANGAAPAKTPRKEKDDKYFGFDDSENLENVSPEKEVGRKKSLRQARARAVLKEMNAQPAPTRAVIPLAAKTARMAEVERLYDEMKSASDAPALSPNEPTITGAANVIEELDDDTQTSVHLFEDVEDIVHHLKPNRKSYGKAKKVTFVRKDSSDSEDSDPRPAPSSDEENDLLDLTFVPGLPMLDEYKKKTKKKPSKRQKRTKKEEEEAEAWAAGFNSMCEDVEGFDLVVE